MIKSVSPWLMKPHTHMHMRVPCQCIHLPSCGLGTGMSMDANFQYIQSQRLWLSKGISGCFLSFAPCTTLTQVLFFSLSWCQLPSTKVKNSKKLVTFLKLHYYHYQSNTHSLFLKIQINKKKKIKFPAIPPPIDN